MGLLGGVSGENHAQAWISQAFFGEAILHLSVLTPNAPRAGCVSPHPPPCLSLLSPFRQDFVFVFLCGTAILPFAVAAASPVSPSAGAAPPEAQLLGGFLGAAEQVTHSRAQLFGYL